MRTHSQLVTTVEAQVVFRQLAVASALGLVGLQEQGELLLGVDGPRVRQLDTKQLSNKDGTFWRVRTVRGEIRGDADGQPDEAGSKRGGVGSLTFRRLVNAVGKAFSYSALPSLVTLFIFDRSSFLFLMVAWSRPRSPAQSSRK